MKNYIHKFLNSNLYSALIICYIVFILFITVFSINIFSSYYSFVNKSISTVSKNSVIIVKAFPYYSVGEKISYYSNKSGYEEILTDVITGDSGNVYTVKADEKDPINRDLVRPRLILGKVLFIIPYLGHILSVTKNITSIWIFVILPAVLIIILELIKIILELKKKY